MNTEISVYADLLWRSITYLSVAQLHLRSNPLISSPLRKTDIKPRPSGHWGTVPGNAWALSHLALAEAYTADTEIAPVIGAGHAGVVQRSFAWLTGALSNEYPQFSRNISGLTSLVSSFPDGDILGSEVHPRLPGGAYLGGCLGGALAFSQGMALDAKDKIVAPIIGDGECETPTTAAAWLAQLALPEARVVPIVHLNGYRMGGRSLLGRLSDNEIAAYAHGLGWHSKIIHVVEGGNSEHFDFHEALLRSIDAAKSGARTIIFLRCVKGWSGPELHHKTPLTNPQRNVHQQVQLAQWMETYRVQELLDDDAQPIGVLKYILDSLPLRQAKNALSKLPEQIETEGRGFSAEITAVLREHARFGDFRVFCPDELRSNRLEYLEQEPWVHEVLSEEVLFGWLSGWTASGRRGVLISYEAFAPLFLPWLIGQLKQRRITTTNYPSINILLTSYGWHNSYTHGDPSFITALLGIDDQAVQVFTPADPDRAAIALDHALRSYGCVNVVIAGKHTRTSYPSESLVYEVRDGLAIWPHVSDLGEPDLLLVCAGDIAAEAVCDAVEMVRIQNSCKVTVLNVHNLTSLRGTALFEKLGKRTPILIVTLGHPAAIWGLLSGSLHHRVEVVGWREPPHPMPQDKLAKYAGMDVEGITLAAKRLLCREEASE